MLEDDAPSDTLSAEELEARRLRALAEAEEELRRKKAEEDAIAAAAAAAAALRAQKEMVRSAAIGRRAQVTIILSEGATIDYLVEGRTALSAAAEGGHLTTVLALLEAGADFNIENQNSSLPPIVAAASEGYTPVVKAFLDFGESPDKSSSAGGMSALIFAALRGYVATMRLLLDRGANPDQRDDVACTALMRAAAEGRLDSVRCLVEYGRADWTLASMGGLDALTWARLKHRQHVVRALEEYMVVWSQCSSAVEFYARYRDAWKLPV